MTCMIRQITRMTRLAPNEALDARPVQHTTNYDHATDAKANDCDSNSSTDVATHQRPV